MSSYTTVSKKPASGNENPIVYGPNISREEYLGELNKRIDRKPNEYHLKVGAVGSPMQESLTKTQQEHLAQILRQPAGLAEVYEHLEPESK